MNPFKRLIDWATGRAKKQAESQSSKKEHQTKPKPSSSSKPKSNSGRPRSSSSSSGSSGGSSGGYRPSTRSYGSTYRSNQGSRTIQQRQQRTSTQTQRGGGRRNPKVTVTKAQTVAERQSGTATTKPKSKGTALTVEERKAQSTQIRTSGAKTKAVSKGNERRGGAERARKNKTLSAVTHGAEYVVNKHAKAVTEAAETAAHAPKTAVERAGYGGKGNRPLAKGGNEKRNAYVEKRNKELRQRQETQSEAVKADNYKHYFSTEKTKDGKYTASQRGKTGKSTQTFASIEKGLHKTTENLDKKAEKSLEIGAKNFSGEKKDYSVPIYTKYKQKQAEEQNKQTVKDTRTQLKTEGKEAKKAARKDFNKYVRENGWTEDTVLNIDGKDITVAEYRRQYLSDIQGDINKSIRKQMREVKKGLPNADDAGKISLSAQDIYKGGVKMANEMVDYAIPYGATTKGAMNAAEAAIKSVKGAKALTEGTVKGGRALTKGGKDFIKKALEEGMKSGKPKAEILKDIRHQIGKSNAISTVEKELLANAMQDASIGTAIDLYKGIKEGYKGDDLKNYMAQNAAMNIAMGVPISAVAGRTGKAGKQMLTEATQKAVNTEYKTIGQMSRSEASEMLKLVKKQDVGLKLTDAETDRLTTLKQKQVESRAGVAQIDNNGNLVVNNNGVIEDMMSPQKLRRWNELQAKRDAGVPLTSAEARRYNEINREVQGAYKAAADNAQMALKTAKSGKAVNMDAMDSAVNYIRKTGDEKAIKEAEKARVDSTMKMFSTKNRGTASIIATAAERSDGKVTIRAIDDDKMREIFGVSQDGVTVNQNGKNIVLLNTTKNKRGVTMTLAHELAHHVMDADSSFLKDLRAFAGEDRWAKQFEETAKPYQQIQAKVESGEIDLNNLGYDLDVNVDEEVACDLLGNLVGETSYFNHLTKEKKPVLFRMVDYLRGVKSEETLADDTFKDLMKRFEDAAFTAREDEAKTIRMAISDADMAEAYNNIDFDDFDSVMAYLNLGNKKNAEEFKNALTDAGYNLGETIDNYDVLRDYYSTFGTVPEKGKYVPSKLDTSGGAWGFSAEEMNKKIPGYYDAVMSKIDADLKGIDGEDGFDWSVGKKNIITHGLTEEKYYKVVWDIEADGTDLNFFSVVKQSDWGDQWIGGEKWTDLDYLKDHSVVWIKDVTPDNYKTVVDDVMFADNFDDVPGNLNAGKVIGEQETSSAANVFDAEDISYIKSEVTKEKDSYLGEYGLALGFKEFTGSDGSSYYVAFDVEPKSTVNYVGIFDEMPQSKDDGNIDFSPALSKVAFKDIDDFDVSLQKLLSVENASLKQEPKMPKPEDMGLYDNYDIQDWVSDAADEIKKDWSNYGEISHEVFPLNNGYHLFANIMDDGYEENILALVKSSDFGGSQYDIMDANIDEIKDKAVNWIDADNTGDFLDMWDDIDTYEMGNMLHKVLGTEKREEPSSWDSYFDFDDPSIPELSDYGYKSDLKPEMPAPSKERPAVTPEQKVPRNRIGMTQREISSQSNDIFRHIRSLVDDGIYVEDVTPLSKGYQAVYVADENDTGFIAVVKDDVEPSDITALFYDDEIEQLQDITESFSKIDSLNYLSNESLQDTIRETLSLGDYVPGAEARPTTPTDSSEDIFETMNRVIEDRSRRGEVIQFNSDKFKQSVEKRYKNLSGRNWQRTKTEFGFAGNTPEEFAKVLEDNGGLKPVKATTSEVRINNHSDGENLAFVREITGESDEDCAQMIYYVNDFTVSQNTVKWDYGESRRYYEDMMNVYAEKMPAYDLPEGEFISRGIEPDDETFDHILEILDSSEPGMVLTSYMHQNAGENGLASSWTTRIETAQSFSGWNSYGNSIIIRCHSNLSGTPIAFLSHYPGEHEIFFGTHSEWTYLGHQMAQVGDGNGRCLYVDVIERAPGAAEPKVKYALGEFAEGDASLVGHLNEKELRKFLGKEYMQADDKIRRSINDALGVPVKTGAKAATKEKLNEHLHAVEKFLENDDMKNARLEARKLINEYGQEFTSKKKGVTLADIKNDDIVKLVQERMSAKDAALEAKKQATLEAGKNAEAKMEVIPEGEKPQPKASPKEIKATSDKVSEIVRNNIPKEEQEYVHDTFNYIVDALRKGDTEEAEAQARALAEDFGNIDEIVERPEAKQELKNAKDYLKEITFHMPQSDGMNYNGSFKAFKKSLGSYDGRILKLRKSTTGKNPSVGIDARWDEMSEMFPEMFPASITDDVERLKRVAEVSKMSQNSLDERIPTPEEFVDGEYAAMGRDIIEEAKKVANQNNEVKPPEAPEAKPEVEADVTGEVEGKSIADQVKEKQGKGKKSEVVAGKYGKSGGEAVDDLKPLDGMSVKELNAEIAASISHIKAARNLYGADSPRVKQLQEHIDRAKQLKDSGAKATLGEEDLPKGLRKGDNFVGEAAAKAEVIEKATGKKPQPKKKPHAFVDKEANYDNFVKAQEEGDLSGTADEVTRKTFTEKAKELKEKVDNARITLREMFVDDMAAFEDIARNIKDSKRREQFLAQTNQMRVAKREGRRIVEDEVDPIFNKYGLGKDEAKARAFEEYTFLTHNIDRIKQGTDIYGGFLDTDKNGQILGSIAGKKADIKELEKKIDKALAAGETPDPKWQESITTKEAEIKDLTAQQEQLKTEAIERVQSILNDLEGRYGKDIKSFQKEVVEFVDSLNKRDLEAGIIGLDGERGYNTLKEKYPNYVPTYRAKKIEGDIDPNELSFEDLVDMNSPDEIDIARGMYKARGGAPGDARIPLYNQLMAKANMVTKRTEENRMMQMVADVIGDIKASDIPYGTDPVSALEAIPHARKENGKNIVTFYKEGKANKIEVNDHVFRELRRWSGEDKINVISYITDPIETVSTPFSRAFKAAITDYNVLFGLKNYVRDQQTAILFTKDLPGYLRAFPKVCAAMTSPKMYKVMPKKAVETCKQYRAVYDVYMKNGGKYSPLVNSTDKPKAIEAWKKANPLKWASDFNAAIETIPRMQEFTASIDADVKALMKGGMSKEAAYKRVLSDHDMVTKAIYRSKDITVNFDRGGTVGKWLNRTTVPFFNPAMQGLDKTFRFLVRDNKSANDFIRMGAMLATGIAAPGALWELKFGDDEDYQALSNYNKDNYYCLPLGSVAKFLPGVSDEEAEALKGKFLKFPKAREVGALQNPLNHFIRNAKFGQPGDWKDMFKLGFEQIGPVSPISDNLYSPIIRLHQNKNWYGGQIENRYEQNLVKDGKSNEVYDENTSYLAISLGQRKAFKDLGISPKKIDNFLDSYTGVVYDMGIGQFNAANDSDGTMSKKIALTGQRILNTNFVVDSYISNKYSGAMYDKQSELYDAVERADKGSKQLREAKKNLRRFNTTYSYDNMTFNQAISDVKSMKKLSAEKKAEVIRDLKYNQRQLQKDSFDGKAHTDVDVYDVLLKHFSFKKVMEEYTYTSKNEQGAETNMLKEAWTAFKDDGGNTKDFKRAFKTLRKFNKYVGESSTNVDYNTTPFVMMELERKGKDTTKLRKAFGINDYNMETAANYFTVYGGTLETYQKDHRKIVNASMKLGYDYTNEIDKAEAAVALAGGKKKTDDRGYYAEKIAEKTNPARCAVIGHNWDYERLSGWAAGHGISCKKTENWTKYHDNKYSPEYVAKCIEEDSNEPTKEGKAAIFALYFPTEENPFGKIGDYFLKSDVGVESGGSGYGGWGRRGYGGGGWGGGGWGGWGGGSGSSGAGAMLGKPKVTDAKAPTGGGALSKMSIGKAKSTDIKVGDYTKIAVGNYTTGSNLDDAYRKRTQKLRQSLRSKK